MLTCFSPLLTYMLAMRISFLITYLFFSSLLQLSAQTGLTAGPPRVYFIADAGQQQVQFVEVTNPSKDYMLELAVSLEDWTYTPLGDNRMEPKGTLANSCAAWISFSEPYFTLQPGESKRVQVTMQVPKNFVSQAENPVHTAMLFITQLNPRARERSDGANIRLAVRSGIKIYHRPNAREVQDVEIDNISYLQVDSATNILAVDFRILANIWMEGKIQTELFNQDTGEKLNLAPVSFYALPNDARKQYIDLPKDLPKGSYLASMIFIYDNQSAVKVGELEFTHEE